MRSASDGGRGVGRGFNGVEVIMVLNMTFATCTAVDSFSGSFKTTLAFHWSLGGLFFGGFVSADPKEPAESLLRKQQQPGSYFNAEQTF